MFRRKEKSKKAPELIYLKSTKHCPRLNILRQGDFSARLLELEMTVEMQDFDIATLHELIDLYNKAIDYYVLSGSQNFLFFKNKLKGLLLKPRVISALKRAEQKTVSHQQMCNLNLGRSTEEMFTEEGSERERAKTEGDVAFGSPRHFPRFTSRPASMAEIGSPEHTIEFDLKMQSFNMDRELNTAHQKTSIKTFLANLTTAEQEKEQILKDSMIHQKDRFVERLRERRQIKRNLSLNPSAAENTRADSLYADQNPSFVREMEGGHHQIDLNGLLNNISLIKEEAEPPSPEKESRAFDLTAQND